MNRKEWDTIGNPPGSFDAVRDMAEQNARIIRGEVRATWTYYGPKYTPHPWDHYVEDAERVEWKPE